MSGSTQRLGLGGVDQAISSASNLIAVVVVARAVTQESFGAFTLAFVGVALTIGFARALGSEPLAFAHAVSAPEVQRDQVRIAVGVATAVSLACALIMLVVSVPAAAPVRGAIAAMGLVLPAVVIQDSWRAGFAAIGRPLDAVVNDIVCGVTQVGLLVMLVHLEATLPVLIVGWGAGALVGAVTGFVQLRARPSFVGVTGWIREHRSLWPRFLTEFAAWTVGWQFGLLLVGWIIGLDAAGAFRGAQTLLGPVNVLLLAVPLVAVPELVRRNATGGVVEPALALVVGLLICTAAWGAIVFGFGDHIGPVLLGETWPSARQVLVPMVLFTAGSVLSIGAFAGLRAIGAAAASMKIRVLNSAGVVLSMGLVALSGVVTKTAWTVAIVNVVVGCLWWMVLIRQAKRRESFRTGVPA